MQIVQINRPTSNENINIIARDGQERATITTFSAQPTEWDYEVPTDMDPTFSTADEDTCSMANFFSRPVRIASYSWAVGGELWETLDPWTEYFENKRVINRITNFALLRCKLCVKIVLNGNGFYFGRTIS